MAYGEYDGSDKHDKGDEGGSCNRRRCQAPNACWYNHGSLRWYCASCREDIENNPFNLQDWNHTWRPSRGHPMFETREMMDARAAKENRHD